MIPHKPEEFPYNGPMPEPLLRTKLFVPPLRPQLVPRPHLITQLNQDLQFGRQLTLISAPAGFGKTTLVSEWVAGLRSSAATDGKTVDRIGWLSLDESDNEPARFLAYLVAAVRQAEGMEATIGSDALTILQSPQPTLTEDVLTSLINDSAALPNRVILVLDDYHLIESSKVDKALTFLIEHLPPQLHLVIVTRVDPNIPLARLRSRGQLTEIRAADLRFKLSEVAQFLNQVMGLDLSAYHIAALESRTEGWIAGLQLAAISMQGRQDTSSLIESFTGSHRYVLDYLIEEVLEQQPETIHSFLRQTAILDRMTGSLCDALTGQDDGQQTLEYLEQANLFIVSLDDERKWYRYHHLFADLLHARIRQSQSDTLADLHIRAAKWFEQNNSPREAVNHALLGRDYDRAARLIERSAANSFQPGQLQALLDWINNLPDELARTRPRQHIYKAWVLATWMLSVSGQFEGVEPLVKDTERLLRSDDFWAMSPIEEQEMLGNLTAIRAFAAVLSNDFTRAIEHATQAIEMLTEESLWACSICQWVRGIVYRERGDLEAAGQSFSEMVRLGKVMSSVFDIVIGMYDLANIYREQGQLRKSAAVYQETLRRADDHDPRNTNNIGPVEAGLAHILCEQDDLAAAYHLAANSINNMSSPNQYVFAHDVLARVLFAQGDLEGASNALQKAAQIMEEYPVISTIVSAVEQTRIRIWLAQDNKQAIERWAAENQDRCIKDNGPLCISLARIYIAQGKTDEALRLLNPLERNATSEQRIDRLIETLVLQSLALQTKNNTVLALEKMERGLDLAKPEGYVRVFVDEGPPMARLLSEAAARGIAPDYARKLLAAFPAVELEQVSESKTRVPQTDLVEPLSEREIEVLQLIAEGLTNPEIAARLFLSLNTVKVHTRNIYGKLAVNNRTLAVARARELGLLRRF